MAGVYIHIPFCKKACHYCNFHFSTTLHQQDSFVNALLNEISLQKNYINEPVETIYFGGGTPSILTIDQINIILDKIKETFSVDNDAEITLEANPDDITTEKLNQWKAAGINRLSIGVQSFFKEDLLWMNRAHDDEQANNCIFMAKTSGFENITIDLIYGTPTLSNEKWKHNVDRAIALGVPHLSCYALTVEPKTALEKLIEKKHLQAVDPEKQARHFEMLMGWMKTAGYEHYEISNFAKPGFRSRHNSSYWQGSHYAGLGPSAHSFNGKARRWNVANNALYIQGLKNGILNYEEEILTKDQQLNEYIMTSLRTIEGIQLKKLKEDFGEEKFQAVIKASDKHIANHHLEMDQQSLRTTTQGKLLADGIASDLFIV